MNSLKGEKGDKGEQGLQGIQGEKGDTGERGADGSNGIDGISPTISIAENTSNSYILTITDVNGSFDTPNLKGQNGTSGSGTSITVDTELSETSENPVQNKIVTQNLSTIQNEITKLNDLIKNLPSGETFTTALFDYSNHEQYLDSFKFKDSQWDDNEYTFQQAIERVPSLCSEEYSNQLRLSSMFGWSANITILCLIPVQLNANSRLLVNYNCTTTGSNITVEVPSSADFISESVATFEDIPSIYVEDELYMSVNLFPNGTIESGTYYLRFKYTTVNPVFLIKSWEYDSFNYAKKQGVTVSKQLCSDMTKAFCEILENYGWYSGFYANIDYLDRFYTQSVKDRFTCWVAQWSTKCTYTGQYGIWQYGAETNKIDSKKVSGVPSATVDKNYCYTDYPNIIKTNGFNGYGKSNETIT